MGTNGTGTFPRGSAGRRTADRSCSVSQPGREGGDAGVTERRDPLTGRPARSNYRVRREEEQEVQEQAQGFQKRERERKKRGGATQDSVWN